MGEIRPAWPEVNIRIRADSGFYREGLLAGCETRGVDSVVERAKNARLQGEITAELEAAALVAVVGEPEPACTLAEAVAGGCRPDWKKYINAWHLLT